MDRHSFESFAKRIVQLSLDAEARDHELRDRRPLETDIERASKNVATIVTHTVLCLIHTYYVAIQAVSRLVLGFAVLPCIILCLMGVHLNIILLIDSTEGLYTHLAVIRDALTALFTTACTEAVPLLQNGTLCEGDACIQVYPAIRYIVNKGCSLFLE